MWLHRSIYENKWYYNSKGNKRFVISKEYNIETQRTKIVYVKNSLNEVGKSCFIEQFIKWMDS
jgi:hypothetical protein